MKQSADTPVCNPDLTPVLANVIKEALLADESVAIPGFGTFFSKKEDEYVVANEDSSKVLMPPSINVSFKASVILRNKLK